MRSSPSHRIFGFPIIALCATLSCCPWLATAAPAVNVEKIVRLEGELNGAWLQPAAAWDGRAILLLHGFADDMNGPGDMSKKLAEALAARGIASFRLNFQGEGNRLRTDIDSTFATRLADTESAMRWLGQQPGLKADRIAVGGASLGAATAIAIGGRHPAWFRAMVLWSALTGDPYTALTQGSMAGAAEEAEQKGMGKLVITGWKTVTLKRAFFTSFRGIDLDSALARYPGAFLSVRGTLDYLPQREAQLLALTKGEPHEAIFIGGADHIFNVFDPTKKYAERVRALTVTWLESVL